MCGERPQRTVTPWFCVVNGLCPTAITWRFSRHRHGLHQAFRAGVTVGKAFGVVDFSRFDEGVEAVSYTHLTLPTKA